MAIEKQRFYFRRGVGAGLDAEAWLALLVDEALQGWQLLDGLTGKLETRKQKLEAERRRAAKRREIPHIRSE